MRKSDQNLIKNSKDLRFEIIAIVVVIVMAVVFSACSDTSDKGPEQNGHTDVIGDQTSEKEGEGNNQTEGEPSIGNPKMEETDSSDEQKVIDYSSLTGDYDKVFFTDTLFIGDSVFTGIDGYGFLPSENVFAKESLAPSAALTAEIKGRTIATTSADFDCAVIMIGANALYDDNGDTVAEDVLALVDKVRESNPEIEIAVLTIPPVAVETEYEHLTIDIIRNFNSALKLSASEKGVLVIDLFSALEGEDGYLHEEYAQPDGVHLTNEAYKIMLDLIQGVLS